MHKLDVFHLMRSAPRVQAGALCVCAHFTPMFACSPAEPQQHTIRVLVLVMLMVGGVGDGVVVVVVVGWARPTSREHRKKSVCVCVGRVISCSRVTSQAHIYPAQKRTKQRPHTKAAPGPSLKGWVGLSGLYTKRT